MNELIIPENFGQAGLRVFVGQVCFIQGRYGYTRCRVVRLTKTQIVVEIKHANGSLTTQKFNLHLRQAGWDSQHNFYPAPSLSFDCKRIEKVLAEQASRKVLKGKCLKLEHLSQKLFSSVDERRVFEDVLMQIENLVSELRAAGA